MKSHLLSLGLTFTIAKAGRGQPDSVTGWNLMKWHQKEDEDFNLLPPYGVYSSTLVAEAVAGCVCGRDRQIIKEKQNYSQK